MSYVLTIRYCKFKFRGVCITGRQLQGDEAPLASQLGAWLEAHPGWEPVEDSDDEDDDDDSDDENSNKSKKINISYLQSEWQVLKIYLSTFLFYSLYSFICRQGRQ